MEALLKRMNEKKSLQRSPSTSKNPSRSMSIASSNGENGEDNEDQLSNSDESK